MSLISNLLLGTLGPLTGYIFVYTLSLLADLKIAVNEKKHLNIKFSVCIPYIVYDSAIVLFIASLLN